MLPIYLCGKEIGFINGTSWGLSASCPMENGYIYRLELVGEGCLSLGVMMPQGNRFVLEKKGDFKLDAWQYGEILRCRSAEPVAAPLPFALSHGKDAGDCSFAEDELLRQCLSVQKGVKTAVYKGRRIVYFPFNINEPCPMAPFFFCLNVFDVAGNPYAAFCIDENNIPVSLTAQI